MYSAFGCSLEVSTLSEKHAAVLNIVCGGARGQTMLSNELFLLVT